LKSYIDCLPCLLNQALRAARAATDDEHIHRQVVDAVAEMIPTFSPHLKPPEITQQAYRVINSITGENDPFRRAKVEANNAVLAIYPKLEKMVSDSTDRLYTACKLAIAGNSIDLGPKFDYGGIDKLLDSISNSVSLAIDDYEKFTKSLDNCRKLLYLGDNAGEIVFDRLLIEEIKRYRDIEVYFVVRGKPVINDATMKDALAAGIDKVATIIPNGADAPATIISRCSPKLQTLLESADVIISKGQGNYEANDTETANIFFFLRAKCQLIAKTLGVKVGDYILKSDRE